MCTMDLSFELQEVLLVRPEGGERLGLTLCYETDAEDGLTDIFVDDIHPDGLAAADGRLRLGDQIIQVRPRGRWQTNIREARKVKKSLIAINGANQ